MNASDAPAPKYIVVCVHDQYEQTVRLFVTEEAALAEVAKWKKNGCEVYLGELRQDSPHPFGPGTPNTLGAERRAKAADWAGCCRASNHLADLVCHMYHPKDAKARQTWPTATWAELIAAELDIQIPGRD